jgi:nicotinamide-nucleotide adenylyltransferase
MLVRGLVVGRFQPLHNGHKALISKALEDCVHIVVGLGSAAAKPSLRNPFSAAERRQMVLSAFPNETAAGQLTVIDIPDLHDPPRWVAHVLQLTGPVDKVYGNDDSTLNLFDVAGLRTVRPGLVDREKYQAKTLRMQMAEDDPSWRKAVPPPVAKLLESWQAGRRLRSMEALA